nr:hypothetical protein [Tanacetum cinerariifolium]
MVTSLGIRHAKSHTLRSKVFDETKAEDNRIPAVVYWPKKNMRIDKVFLGFFASIAEAKKSNQCSFRARPKDPILLQLKLLIAPNGAWSFWGGVVEAVESVGNVKEWQERGEKWGCGELAGKMVNDEQ